MYVQMLEGLDGAGQARGLAVVIDVFRAFSVACYAVDNGADRIIAVSEVDTARRLRSENPDCVLMGERDCVMLPGFDFGNSPTEIKDQDFAGKTIVHTTSAGTRGLAACIGADEIITGSFVNAQAIVDYINKKSPQYVSLVAMGTAGVERSMEDTMCAMYIKNALEDYANSFESLKNFFKTIESAAKFFDPDKSYAPEEDFELCLSLDRFDFVLRAEVVGPDQLELKIAL